MLARKWEKRGGRKKIGEERGEKKKSIEIAKEFLRQGLDVTLISKIIGLPIEKSKKSRTND